MFFFKSIAAPSSKPSVLKSVICKLKSYTVMTRNVLVETHTLGNYHFSQTRRLTPVISIIDGVTGLPPERLNIFEYKDPTNVVRLCTEYRSYWTKPVCYPGHSIVKFTDNLGKVHRIPKNEIKKITTSTPVLKESVTKEIQEVVKL